MLCWKGPMAWNWSWHHPQSLCREQQCWSEYRPKKWTPTQSKGLRDKALVPCYDNFIRDMQGDRWRPLERPGDVLQYDFVAGLPTSWKSVSIKKLIDTHLNNCTDVRSDHVMATSTDRTESKTSAALSKVLKLVCKSNGEPRVQIDKLDGLA